MGGAKVGEGRTAETPKLSASVRQILVSWNLPYLNERDIIEVAHETALLLPIRAQVEAEIRDALPKPVSLEPDDRPNLKKLAPLLRRAALALANCVFVQIDLDEIEVAHIQEPHDTEVLMRLNDERERLSAAKSLAIEALQEWATLKREREVAKGLAREVRRRVDEKGWSRAEFAKEAGISPSTAYNLMVAPLPGRRWRPSITRLVEDALNWERGSIETILEGGKPVVVSGPPHWGDFAEAVKTESARAVYLEPKTADEIEAVALREGRSANKVIADALRVYLKVYGPET